jgi:hypothetical protein
VLPLIDWQNFEVAVLDAAVAAITQLMDRNAARVGLIDEWH